MSLVSSLNQDGKYAIMETDIESNKYLLKKYFEDIYNGYGFYNIRKTISLHPILQQYMDKNDFSITLDAFINIPQVANLQLDSQCILDLIKANDHIVFAEKDTKIIPMYSSRSCLIVRDMPSHTTFQDMLNIFEGVEPKPLYIEGVGNECWYIYFEKRSSANQCYLVLLAKDPTISNKMRPKYKDAILPGNLTYAKAKYSEQFQIVESEQKEQEQHPFSMSQSGLPNTFSSSEPITLVLPAKENRNANHAATPAYNNSGHHQGFSNMNKAHSIDVLNTVTPPAIIKDLIPPQLSNYGLIVSNKQHYDGQHKTLDYIKASSNNMLYPTPPLQQNQAGAGNKYATNTHYFNNKQQHLVPNYNNKNAPLAYKQQHLYPSSLHNHNNTGMISNKNNLNRNSSERNLITNGSGSVLNSFVLSHNISPSYANNISNSNPKQQHGFESANIHSVNSNKHSQTAFVANPQGYMPPPPPSALLPPPLVGSSVFKTTSAATQNNNCVNENAGLIFPPLPPPPPPFMGSTPSTLASTLPYPSNVVPTNNQFGGQAAPANVFWCMPPLPPSLLPLPPHHHPHHLPFPPLPHYQQQIMPTPPMLAPAYQQQQLQRSQSSQNNLNISTKPPMNNGNSNAFYMTPRGVDGNMFAGMNKMVQVPPGQVPFFLHQAAAAANSFLLPPPYPHHSQINHNANSIHKYKLAATPEPVSQSNKLPYYPLNNSNNKINTANPSSISPKNYSPPSQAKDAFIVSKLTLAACGVGPLSTIPPQSTALRSQVTSINMYNSIATPFYYYPPPPVSQSGGGTHLQFPQMLHHPTPTPLLIQPTPPTELMNDSSNAFRPTYNQYAPRNPVNNNINAFGTKKEAKSHQTNHRVNLSSHDSTGINNYSNNGGGKANFQTGKPLPLLPPPLSVATAVYPKDIAPINKSYEYKYKGKHNNNMSNTDFNPSITVSHTLYNSNNYTAKNHYNTTGYNRNKRDFQTVITSTPTCFTNLVKYNQTSNIYPHKTSNKHQAVIANSKFNHHTNSLSNDNTNSLATFNNSERKFQHKSQSDNASTNLNISLYADSRFSQAENTFKPNKEITPKNASEAKASIDLANLERLSISERNHEQESAICSIATSPTPTNIFLDAVLNDVEESFMNGGKISYAQIVNRKMIANNTKILSNHQISPKSLKATTSINMSVSHVVDKQTITSNTKTCNNDVLVAKIDEKIVASTLIENGNAKNIKSSPIANEWTTATGPNNSRRHRGPLKNRSTDLSKNIGEESAKAIVSAPASKINVHNNIESHYATSSIKMTNNTSPGSKTTTQGKNTCSTTLASSSILPIVTTSSARVTKTHQSNIKISQNTNKTTTVNSNTTQRANVRPAGAAPSQTRKNRSYKFKLSELPFHPLNVRARELEKQRLEQQQKGRESQQDSKTVNYDKDRNDIDFPPITHKNSTGIANKLSPEGNQSDTKRNHTLTDKFESNKSIAIITSANDAKNESIITANNNASLDSKSVASSNDESSAASFKSSSSTFLSSSLDPSSPPQLKVKNLENKTSTTSYLATTQHPPSVRSNSYNRERSVKNNEDNKNYLKIDNSASNSSLDKKEMMDTKKHTTERLLNGYVI